MTAAEIDTHPTGDEGEPGWLTTPGGEAFCWYHAPIGTPRDVAVLLCDPLGSDRMNLHLAYRYLALALAQAGFATLRLDLPGTCDSADTPRHPGRVPAWFAALSAGADCLRARSGATSLALFGARFGGTLALVLASERQDVTHVAAWGAYSGAKSFLRNETAFDRLSGANPRQIRPTLWKDGDVEAAGFLFSAETVADLRDLTIGGDGRLQGKSALVVGWELDTVDESLATDLRSAGAEVTSIPGPDDGVASLQHQQVPSALIDRFVTWLPARLLTVADPEAGGAGKLKAEVELDWDGRRILERCVRFGRNQDLFGVLSMPIDGPDPSEKTAVILVNGGNNHRVGINRNYVEWARQWAGFGVPVLRFDIRGLGDSPPRRPEDLNRLYLDATVGDLKEAGDWLERTLGTDRLVVCGLCAGAYQGLHFARRDSRVCGLMLLELLRFYTWEPLQVHGPGLSKRLKRLWLRVHPGWLVDRNRIGRWLMALCGRGTRCLVVYREDERMLDRFRRETGPFAQALEQSSGYELLQVGSSNHILSPLWVQESLTRTLADYVSSFGARVDDAASRSIS